MPAARRSAASTRIRQTIADHVRGMAESAHLYQDALRWSARRPGCTLLLVPNADATAWLTSPEYIAEHHVGVVALRPNLEPPAWFRGVLTEFVRTSSDASDDG